MSAALRYGAAAAMGMLLAHVGFGLSDWQFWAIFFTMLIHGIGCSLERKS